MKFFYFKKMALLTVIKCNFTFDFYLFLIDVKRKKYKVITLCSPNINLTADKNTNKNTNHE